MKVLVVGSINVDLVAKIDKDIRPGETIIGENFNKYNGGKGANQAVSCQRLESQCSFIGAVGNDMFGKNIIKDISEEGINVEGVKTVENISTGVAIITVLKDGNNQIIVIPGANNQVFPQDIDENIFLLKDSDIIVIQNEIPIETVEYIIKKGYELGKVIVYNPAPYKEFDKNLIKKIDYFVPNETELMSFLKIDQIDKKILIDKGNLLIKEGLKNLIVTLGEQGIFFKSSEAEEFIPAYKVDVIDTTGAGDSFIGGFVSRMACGFNVIDSIEFGIKTSAIAIGREGAQSSFPTKVEVENFRGDKNEKVWNN